VCLSKEPYFAAKAPCISVTETYVPTEGRESCRSEDVGVCMRERHTERQRETHRETARDSEI